MSTIDHVHGSAFQLTNVSVPFVVSQQALTSFEIEIGNDLNDGIKFAHISVAVTPNGVVGVHAEITPKGGSSRTYRLELGNILDNTFREERATEEAAE